ncbi:MAG TPA: hypothetical protein VFY40_18810 [Blastocatellia bacterium]|nr:hypothetical protein [Blastocatellia bacterium]
MKTMTKFAREFCAEGLLERPRYFPRQLITPAEMTLEQNYFRDKMRRHNRLLHGWGVVCGARVCLVPDADNSDAEPWKVTVHPGYILGPYGDEIVIDRERVIDLRTEGLISVCGEPGGESDDPWRSDVFVRRPDDGGEITVYVAVKYKEILARPVRVQPASCGCGDTHCEFSRFCDGSEIGVLNNCPDSHKNPPPADFESLVTGKLLDCPECPTDPWVVLARVKLTSDGVIQEIDNCSCRRIVISFGRFWRRCVSDMITIDTVTPEELNRGAEHKITVTGTNLLSNSPSMVSLGAGVNVTKVESPAGAGGKQLVITVNVDADAAIGPRDLRVINPDCSTAITQITVSGQTLAPGPGPQPESRPQRVAAIETPSKRAASKKRRG